MKGQSSTTQQITINLVPRSKILLWGQGIVVFIFFLEETFGFRSTSLSFFLLSKPTKCEQENMLLSRVSLRQDKCQFLFFCNNLLEMNYGFEKVCFVGGDHDKGQKAFFKTPKECLTCHERHTFGLPVSWLEHQISWEIPSMAIFNFFTSFVIFEMPKGK